MTTNQTAATATATNNQVVTANLAGMTYKEANALIKDITKQSKQAITTPAAIIKTLCTASDDPTAPKVHPRIAAFFPKNKDARYAARIATLDRLPYITAPDSDVRTYLTTTTNAARAVARPHAEDFDGRVHNVHGRIYTEKLPNGNYIAYTLESYRAPLMQKATTEAGTVIDVPVPGRFTTAVRHVYLADNKGRFNPAQVIDAFYHAIGLFAALADLQIAEAQALADKQIAKSPAGTVSSNGSAHQQQHAQEANESVQTEMANMIDNGAGAA